MTPDPTIAMELKDLRTAYWRYKTMRRMNATDYNHAWALSISTGKPFDQIIDEWLPLYFPGVKK